MAPTQLPHLQQAVDALRIARAERAQADSVVQELELAFFGTIQTEYDRQKAARAAEEAAETMVKALALSVYGEDPTNKQVAPGVSIAVKTSFQYPEQDAFQFAKAKDLAIVPEKLDSKAFEKLLGALSALPAFVTKVETPSVRIATALVAPTVAPAAAEPSQEQAA